MMYAIATSFSGEGFSRFPSPLSKHGGAAAPQRDVDEQQREGERDQHRRERRVLVQDAGRGGEDGGGVGSTLPPVVRASCSRSRVFVPSRRNSRPLSPVAAP